MDKDLIIEKVTDIAADVTRANGFELVNVEIAGTKRDQVLRIFIDKDGGVTLDDCSLVSRGMEDILDEQDFIPSRYVLEVSSPGIERGLYSLKDFERFTGELAKVKTIVAIDGRKAFVGRILSVDGENINIDERAIGEMTIEYSNIEKANLKIDLAKEFSR